MSSTRTMVLWCPDWPVTAAIRAELVSADEPCAVFRANRVVAASALARESGVFRAMRRREAQSRCPELVVLDDDPARDARLYEQVASVIDAYTPRIEVVRPGLCQFPTKGPSRYFGGDAALADTLRLALAQHGVEVRIGVGDGAFTAALAARRPHVDGDDTHCLVAAGESAAYLRDMSIRALIAVEGGRAVTRAASRGSSPARRSQSSRSTPTDALALIDLIDLLQRLGISTLGAFAALPAADVVARFGPVGERAWRLAQGLDAHPPQTRTPPPDLVVSMELDPPVDRVDTAAFLAKSMADDFHERMQREGLACTRVSIEAETADGASLVRLWRHERAGEAGGLTAQNLADRLRWQIDGWLQQRSIADQKAALALMPKHMRAKDTDVAVLDMPERLTGGLSMLRLVPDEVVPDTGRQLRLWGGASAADERASRAFARVQGLLGPDAVTTPVRVGGRRPSELIALVPWGDDRATPQTADQPWPGRLPSPLPTVVHPLPLAASVLDEHDHAVRVSGRGELLTRPWTLQIDGQREGQRPQRSRITTWAGPWPLEERWWDIQSARRQARMQIITDTQRAYLVVVEGSSWWVEGEYQ